MSPSLQTMGFFMSDINFCNTKEQLNHLGEVVTGKTNGSPSGADIETSTLPYTGQVRNTLPALEELYLGEINEFIQESDQVITDKTAELDAAVDSFIQESNQVITDKTDEFDTSIANKEAEASAAIDSYRLLNKGPYTSGITLESKFEYITYSGESYFATNPPYTTTATLPDADGNLFAGAYLTSQQLPLYTDILYKDSGGNSAFDNMVANANIGEKSSVGSSSFLRTSEASGDISDFEIITKLNRAEDLGVIYNDPSKATENYQTLVYIANSGGVTVLIEDNLYCLSSSATVSDGIALYFTPGKSITWTGSEAFKLESGAYWIERNPTHISSSPLWYMGYSSKDNYIPHIQFENPSFKGDIFFRFESDLDKNPEDPATPKFGFGSVTFEGMTLRERVNTFWYAPSQPYDHMSFNYADVYDFQQIVIACPVANGHPYYEQIQRSMRYMDVSNAIVSNPEDRFGDDTASTYSAGYHCFVLWEGNKLDFNNNTISELKGKSGISVYDVYQAGLEFNSDGCRTLNCYAFNDTSGINAGVFFKKVVSSSVNDKKYTFSPDFFTRMSSNHGLDAASSNADWVSYDPEIGGGAKRYELTNSRIEMPHLNSASVATKLVRQFDFQSNEFICNGSGQFNIINAKWVAENSEPNRSIRFNNNLIYAPNCDTSVLCKLSLGSDRVGMIIDLSENDITAKGVRELQCESEGGFDVASATIDELRLGNTITVTEAYDITTPYNRYPRFKQVFLGITDVHSNIFDPLLRGPSMMAIPSGSLSGKYKQTMIASTNPYSVIQQFGLPSESYVTDKNFVYSGKIIDSTGVYEFSISLIVSNIDKVNNTLDITYKNTSGAAQTITWNGSGTTRTINVNSTHPTLECRILRGTGDLRFILDPAASGSYIFDIDYNIF